MGHHQLVRNPFHTFPARVPARSQETCIWKRASAPSRHWPSCPATPSGCVKLPELKRQLRVFPDKLPNKRVFPPFLALSPDNHTLAIPEPETDMKFSSGISTVIGNSGFSQGHPTSSFRRRSRRTARCWQPAVSINDQSCGRWTPGSWSTRSEGKRTRCAMWRFRRTDTCWPRSGTMMPWSSCGTQRRERDASPFGIRDTFGLRRGRWAARHREGRARCCRA